MNHYLIFSILLFLISCSDQSKDNKAEQNKYSWTKPKLEGHWKFVTAKKVEGTPFLSHYPNPHTPAREERPPELPYKGPYLIFENDTMYEVNYPIDLGIRVHYSVDSGYLHNHFKWHTSSCPVELVNDTLFIYKPIYEKEYVKEGYVKTSFNNSIITIIKKYGVNYAEIGHLVAHS